MHVFLYFLLRYAYLCLFSFHSHKINIRINISHFFNYKISLFIFFPYNKICYSFYKKRYSYCYHYISLLSSKVYHSCFIQHGSICNYDCISILINPLSHCVNPVCSLKLFFPWTTLGIRTLG